MNVQSEAAMDIATYVFAKIYGDGTIATSRGEFSLSRSNHLQTRRRPVG
jgi:hypothetical protein